MMEPPPKRRKLEHITSEEPDEGDYSTFLQPKPHRKPRVGSEFQAPIPALAEPSHYESPNIEQTAQDVAMNEPPKYIECNALIVGDLAVGKTSLILRHTDGVFSTESNPSEGSTSLIHGLEEGSNVKLKIFEKFSGDYDSHSSGAPLTDGVLIVFDITNRASFLSIQPLLEKLKQKSQASKLLTTIIVGTKCDLASERSVIKEEAKEFAESRGMSYFEVSAKTGEGVENVFVELVEAIGDLRELAMESQSITPEILRALLMIRGEPLKSREDHLEDLKADLELRFKSFSDDELLKFFPITRKPPKASRVGEKYQATTLPNVTKEYATPDPERVGPQIELKAVPSDLEKLRSERDAQRKNADKEDEENKDSGFALQSLYDMNFDDDDESDDEEFNAEPTEIVHVIDKKLDWLPGDPKNQESARDIVLVLYRNGNRAWKYPEEIEEFSHLIQLFDEEHGLKEEEEYDFVLDDVTGAEKKLSDVDVEELKRETDAVMREMDEPPPVLPTANQETTSTLGTSESKKSDTNTSNNEITPSGEDSMNES